MQWSYVFLALTHQYVVVQVVILPIMFLASRAHHPPEQLAQGDHPPHLVQMITMDLKMSVPVHSELFSLTHSPPSATFMRHWIRSALVQVMACRLFGTKPLSKSIEPNWNKPQWNFNQNKKISFTKMHLKYCPQNGGHFVQGRDGLVYRCPSTRQC